MKYLVTIFLMIFTFDIAYTQQLAIGNQYLVNNFSLSPAYAGLNGNIESFFGVRRNWVGVPGAPKQQLLNINMPLQKDQAGVGLSIVNEGSGNYEYFSALMSYAYHIEINKEMTFSLSLGLETYRNQLDLSSVKGAMDDALLQQKEALRGTSFDATVSGLLYMKKFTAGFVVPRSIGVMKVHYDKDIESSVFTLNRHYIVHASYPIEVKKDLIVKPFMVGRMTSNTPLFFEVSALANYKKWIWGGATYRKGNSVGLHIGGSLDEKIIMNYSYEFGFGNILGVSSGTHEITIGYLIKTGKRPEDLTSFKKAEKKENALDDKKLVALKKSFDTYKKSNNSEIKKLKEAVEKLKDDMNKEKVGEYGKPYRLKNIKFGTNSDRLFSSSFSSLDKLVRRLTEKKNLKILIVGHTDNVGSPRYNQRLSEKRAESVKRYLVSQGISADRIETGGKGEDESEATNETNEGRAINRRIMVAEKE